MFRRPCFGKWQVLSIMTVPKITKDIFQEKMFHYKVILYFYVFDIIIKSDFMSTYQFDIFKKVRYLN